MNLCSTTNQCVTLLLATLNVFDRPATKRETLDYISEQDWFDIRSEDCDPYPSETFPEPRWGKLIAWTRKHAIQKGLLVEYKAEDNWHISPSGKEELRRRLVLFQMRRVRVNDCYLWTMTFKKHVDPTYSWDNDAKRPRLIYDDAKRRFLEELAMED